MAATAFASSGATGQATPRNRSASPMCWLFGLARAALAWACIGFADWLPEHLPNAIPQLQLGTFLLCVVVGFVLLFWAADCVRERN